MHIVMIPKCKSVHTNFVALVANREENTLNNIFSMQISVKYGNTNNLKVDAIVLIFGYGLSISVFLSKLKNITFESSRRTSLLI